MREKKYPTRMHGAEELGGGRMNGIPDPGVIGRNIRRIMKREQISFGLLAEWLGVHINTIRNWTEEGRCPSADKLYAVSKVLKRPMEDFFKEEGA